MIRRCYCGCEDFYAYVVQERLSDGLVCFSDPNEAHICERDLTGHTHKMESYIGPFECVDCNRVYDNEEDIPAVE